MKSVSWAILIVASPVVAAVALAHAFPPYEQGWVAWFALVPFCLTVPGRTWQFERYLGGTIAGLVFYGIGLDFIDTFQETMSQTESRQFNRLWLLATGLVIWVWPLTLLCARFLHLRAGCPLAVAFPTAWVVVEHLRNWFCWVLVGNECPWLHLGYSQVDCGWILQAASVGGVGLVSGLVVASNAIVAVGILSIATRRQPAAREACGIVLAAFALVAAAFNGMVGLSPGGNYPTYRVALAPWRMTIPDARIEVATLRLALGQADSESTGKMSEDRETGVDFVLFGEHSAGQVALDPGLIENNRTGGKSARWDDVLGEIAHSLNTHLVVGAMRSEPGSGLGDPPLWYNCAVHVSPTGEILAWSDKSMLLPFAEFVPAWASHAWLGDSLSIRAQHRGLETGVRLQVFSLEWQNPRRRLRLRAAICNDVSSTSLFRAAARDSDAFAVLGNEPRDSRGCTAAWLLNMTRCRAVETRRAIVRTSIQGTSAIIDPWGRILAKAVSVKTNDTEMIVGSFPIISTRTLYQRWGDWPPHLGAILIASTLIRSRKRRQSMNEHGEKEQAQRGHH